MPAYRNAAVPGVLYRLGGRVDERHVRTLLLVLLIVLAVVGCGGNDGGGGGGGY